MKFTSFGVEIGGNGEVGFSILIVPLFLIFLLHIYKKEQIIIK